MTLPMHGWLRLLLVSAVAATASANAFRQSPARPHDPAVAYRQIVERYRAADAEALRHLAAMPQPATRAVVDDILSGTVLGWTAGDLEAAAMLHTDTYFELVKAGHLDPGVAHINIAGALIDRAMDGGRAHQSYGLRWYGVVTAMLQAYGIRVWADEFAKRARVRASASGASGALDAALREELEAAKERPRPRFETRSPAAVQAELARRYSAIARMFEKAVHLDPECYVGWLHLGRTRMLAGDDAEAAAAFERSLGAADRRHRYLALMFTGAIAERQGRFDEAQRRYRDAASVYPWGQSAPIALAHLLGRMTRDAEARDLLEKHHERTKGIVADPLWTYLLGTDEHLAALLNELRVEVWQ